MIVKTVSLIVTFCSIFSLYAGDWRGHWIDAVTVCDQQNCSEAELAFNKAICCMEEAGDDTHPHVYVDRARLYSLNERYDEALCDLSRALSSPYLRHSDRDRALFTRMIVFYQLDRIDEGIQDLRDYRLIANIPNAEFSDDTIIIRNIPDGECHRNYIKKVLVGTGLCEDPLDIQMLNSGICIAKRKPCQCQSEMSHSRCDDFPWSQSEVADRASRDASIVEPIDKERDARDALRFGCQENQAQREWLEISSTVMDGSCDPLRD